MEWLVQGSELIPYSIIFIHGLRGHPRKTWEGRRETRPRGNFFGSFHKSKSTLSIPDSTQVFSNQVFWPQELLAEDIPQATIWTYGYNADVIGMFEANNQNSVYQHGRDLEIILERDIDNKVKPRAYVEID